MKLFAVFKCAVYRHQCAGVFSTLELAEGAAERCINGEHDDHHSYELVPFELDVQTPQMQTPLNCRPSWANTGKLKEAGAICTWSRENGVVSKSYATD